jgi:hypothetical protein
MRNKLGPLTVILAVLLGLGVIAIGGATFFGGTKIRPLFGLSADALEAGAGDAGAR